MLLFFSAANSRNYETTVNLFINCAKLNTTGNYRRAVRQMISKLKRASFRRHKENAVCVSLQTVPRQRTPLPNSVRVHEPIRIQVYYSVFCVNCLKYIRLFSSSANVYLSCMDSLSEFSDV